MKVFEVVMVLNPSPEDVKKGVQPDIVVDLKRFLANDEAQANMLVGRMIPDNCLDKLSRLDVAIRPF